MFIFLLISLFFSPLSYSSCTYQTWEWDTTLKKSINKKIISKSKSSLTKEEIGSVAGCSVCEEDQVEIKISNIHPFKMCKVFKDRILSVIKNAANNGFPLYSISGYRVGKTKGPLDSKGIRTEFSHHSYGTAIDFNAEINGLYDQCIEFNAHCRLIRGGIYDPRKNGAITKQSILYQSMIRAGFKWGGEIKGKQKDFMHFSLNGY